MYLLCAVIPNKISEGGWEGDNYLETFSCIFASIGTGVYELSDAGIHLKESCLFLLLRVSSTGPHQWRPGTLSSISRLIIPFCLPLDSFGAV